MISLPGQIHRKNFKFDLQKLQSYLTNKLAHKQFGQGLTEVCFRFGIFKFDGQATSYFESSEKNLAYSTKTQSLYITRNIDYNIIAKLNKDELFKYYKEIFRENIELIAASRKVPKKFDLAAFKQSFYNYLDAYMP